jgi:arginase
MSRTIHLLGVPTSAGAHWPGQEKAPEALRQAGLVEHLAASGASIVDRGDLERTRWRIERREVDGHIVNNLDTTVAVAERVADEISDALRHDGFPVAIGGDCTITVGAYAGALRAGLDPALVYVDGGWDLSVPAIYPAGILDSMGAGHLLGVDGATRLRDIGPRTPMLAPDQYIQFGHAPESPESPERKVATALSLTGIPAASIRGRGAEAARDMLASRLREDQPYWLHFDVDVIDFFDLPLADVPIYDEASSFADSIAAVGVLVSDPRCVGMTVTEFNPDHGSLDGQEATLLAKYLASIIAPVA